MAAKKHANSRRNSANAVKRRKHAKISKRHFRKLNRRISKGKKEKELGDPLQVPLPPSWLSNSQCAKIISLKRSQYKLWGWAVALALLLILSATLIELLLSFGALGGMGHAYVANLELASMFAIGILGLELASSFWKAKDKIIFIKHNWIIILAILPIGIIARAGKAFEGLALLEELSSLRALQAAFKVGELRAILPALELPFGAGTQLASIASNVLKSLGESYELAQKLMKL